MASVGRDCDMIDLSIAVSYLLKYVEKWQTSTLNALSDKVKRELKTQVEMNRRVIDEFETYKLLLFLSSQKVKELDLDLNESRYRNLTYEKKWNNIVSQNQKLNDEVQQLGIKENFLNERLRAEIEKHEAAARKEALSLTKERSHHDSYVTDLEKTIQDCRDKIIELKIKNEREVQAKERQLYQQKVMLQKNINEKDKIIISKDIIIESLHQHIKDLEIKLESIVQGKRVINDLTEGNKLLEKKYEKLSDEVGVVFESLSDTDVQLDELLSSLKKQSVAMSKREMGDCTKDNDNELNDQQFKWKEMASSIKKKVERLHRGNCNKNLAMKNIHGQVDITDTRSSDTNLIQKSEKKDICEQVNEDFNDKAILQRQLDQAEAEMAHMHDMLKHKENDLIELTKEKFCLEETLEENDEHLQKLKDKLTQQHHNDKEKSDVVLSLEKKNHDLVKKLDKMKINMDEKNEHYEHAVQKNIENEEMISQLRDGMDQNLSDFHSREEEIHQTLIKLRKDLKERDDRISELCNEIKRISQREIKIQRQGTDMDEMMNCLKSEINFKEQKLEETEERLSIITNEFIQLKSQKVYLEHKLEEIKEELRIQKTQSSNKMKDSDERVLIIEKKNREMETELLERDQKINDLERRNKKLKDICDNDAYQVSEKDLKISELKMNITQSNLKITDLNESVVSLNKEVKNKEKHISILDDKLKQYTHNTVENKETMDHMERRIIALEKEVKEKDGKIVDTKAKLQQNSKQRQEMQSSFENIISTNDKRILDLKKEIEQRDAQVKDLEKMLADKSSGDQTDRGRNMSTSVKKEIGDLKEQLKQALSKLHDKEAELDETKTRLSKAMGDRLTDNNPNITDLSDRNRPTKLAEKCAELYDNQWTDAFEVLQKYFQNDENVIEALLRILQATMTFCCSKAKYQIQELGRALAFADKHMTAELSPAMYKLLKDIRKASASSAVGNLLKMYITHLKQSSDQILIKALEIKEFTTECLEMCWLMMINDPPVAFSPLLEKRSVFNSDLYKPYTSSGTHVEYVVWPALLLHEGGPVLAKGVAQGFSKSKKNAHLSNKLQR